LVNCLTLDASYYLASLPIKKYFPELEEDVIVPPHAHEQKKVGRREGRRARGEEGMMARANGEHQSATNRGLG